MPHCNIMTSAEKYHNRYPAYLVIAKTPRLFVEIATASGGCEWTRLTESALTLCCFQDILDIELKY